jgi:hypothetical protein
MQRFLPVLVALVALGCRGPAAAEAGDGGASHDFALPPPFCTGDMEPPATLSSVEQITATNCAVPACHDGSPLQAPPMMDLRPGHVYANLVGVLAMETCGGVRVVPGDAGVSYLFHKLHDDTPCDGLQMPRCELGSCPIPDCAIDVVRRWIEAGAPGAP